MRFDRTQYYTRALTVLGFLLLSLTGTLGCEAGREFRSAALPAIESGVSSILNGVLDGFFAAIEPEPNSN